MTGRRRGGDDVKRARRPNSERHWYRGQNVLSSNLLPFLLCLMVMYSMPSPSIVRGKNTSRKLQTYGR